MTANRNLLPASVTYAIAKAAQQQLEADVAAASARLEAVRGSERGPMGLTPDRIKASADWRAARSEYDRAARGLRDFNSQFIRRFKNEIQAERDRKRAARA